MVRLAGVLGPREHDVGSLNERLVLPETSAKTTFTDPVLDLDLRYHPLYSSDQPATVAGGETLVWLLGDVYSFRGADGHEPRPEDVDAVTYVAERYEEYGRACFERLNGEFVCLVYDRESDEATIVTDRLGSRPVFSTRTASGAVAIASSIQLLPRHPGVETRFDEKYVREYLAFRRTFGLRTPLEGIQKLPPGSMTTIDLDTGEASTESYWQPVYDPLDESLDYFVDRFADTLETVLSEWTRPDLTYGLLLSGGSDSRALLSAFDRPVTAYHLFDWMGREARVAERVAMTADADLTLLRRPEDHLSQALDDAGDVSNFTGWFSQAHINGFEEEIAADVDVLVSGLYADTLFKDEPLSKPRVPVPKLGSVQLPVTSRDGDVTDTVERMCADLTEAEGMNTSRLRSLLSENIERRNGTVIHHGVEYDSLDELLLCSLYYPLTNDTDRIFTASVRHSLPYRLPFLDNRLLDLHLRVPVRYRSRNNLVNRYLEQAAPELAAIPHAGTGVAPKRPFSLEFLGTNLNAFWWKHVSRSSPPEPHLQQKSWTDISEAIRQQDFVSRTLMEHSDTLRALPGVSTDEAWEWYDRHLDGETNTAPLFGLMTLLRMPVTGWLCDDDQDDTAQPEPWRVESH